MPRSREAPSKTEVRESRFRNSAAPAVIAGPLVESWPVDFSEATFHRYAGFLCDRRLSHPAKASLKAGVLKQQRRSYGNQYV